MFTLLAEVSFRHGFICVADIRVVASRTYYANAKRRKRLREKPCLKENSAGRVRDVLFDWSNRRTITTSPWDGRKGGLGTRFKYLINNNIYHSALLCWNV